MYKAGTEVVIVIEKIVGLTDVQYKNISLL